MAAGAAGPCLPGAEVADISAAETAGAWKAFRRAVAELTPEAVIHTVTESGLRGLGGAGYPTGAKWRDCVSQPDPVHYVVANGFEADPGAQLDRSLMERDPHLVVEGVAITAWAVGAERAIIAVSSTAPVAAERLRVAVDEAEERGYIGRSPDGRSLDIEVREVTGSFVVGEETVLLRALEGKRAQPDQRPPFPTRAGLWGKPTVVNNVKTLAAVPWIVATAPAPTPRSAPPRPPARRCYSWVARSRGRGSWRCRSGRPCARSSTAPAAHRRARSRPCSWAAPPVASCPPMRSTRR